MGWGDRQNPVVLRVVPVCGIVIALSAFCSGADYTVHVVEPPVTNHMILRDGPLPPVCQQATRMKLFACRGEYEPASFVVTASEPLEEVRIEMEPLIGPGGQWPAEAVDVRVVKYLHRWTLGNLATAVPTLLVHDESFLPIEPVPSPSYDWKKMQDTAELLPVSIKQRKQFWMTVHVPVDARPGTYQTTVRIVAKDSDLSKLTLEVEVYPFDLLPSMLEYSIYHPVDVVPAGSEDWRSGRWGGDDAGNGAYITPQQYIAECKNMLAHGLTNPNLYVGAELDQAGKMHFTRLNERLDLREKSGMRPGGPLYIFDGGGVLVLARKLSEEEKQSIAQATRKLVAWARARGYADVYIMGHDEVKGEKLRAERDSWQAIHDGGGKIWVACGTDFFEISGDLLDRPILSAGSHSRINKFAPANYSKTEFLRHMPEIAEVGSFTWMLRADYRAVIDNIHRLGRKIYVYGNPRGGLLLPELRRRNDGLGLWRVGFDGTMNWSYTHIDGEGVRQRMSYGTVYRTDGGVLDTLHWEGFREGVDDVRYLTTLLATLGSCTGRFPEEGLISQTTEWLRRVDVAGGDLDVIRRKMAQRIIELLELGAS